MKKIKIFNYCVIMLLLGTAVSCTKELKDLNKNKVNPTTLDPVLLLNNAIF